MDKRPSWDEYFVEIAEIVSKRSTCLSRQVGAVITKDNNIISTGYNGPAKGVKHCLEYGGCIRKQKEGYQSGAFLELCPASHAEQNAIAQAAKHGISVNDSVVYVTTFPCKDCMNSLINSGVKKIVYVGDYNASLSKEIVKQVAVELVEFKK